MQTIWKGTVSFGLVSIPVRLFSATQERGVSFHQVHEADGGRIRYKRYCEKDGEEVAYRDIAKGYELPDGDTVILTDEDFEALPLSTSRTVDVLQFVPLEQVDPVYVNRSYYLQADGAGLKPYVLLRDALEQAGKAALVKVALRNRESLAVVRPRGDVLMMQTMLWPDEVRDPALVAPEEDVTVREQEVAMAESYIDTLAGDLELDSYTDEYRRALEELVNAKVAGREVAPREEKKDSGVVVDLMEALRQSVEAAKKGRTPASAPGHGRDADAESDADTESSSGSRTARKATSKRAPAKKSSATKASAAGGSARKSAAKASGDTASARKSAASAKKAPGRTASSRSTSKKSAASSGDGKAAKTNPARRTRKSA